jgi:hypothetical protein
MVWPHFSDALSIAIGCMGFPKSNRFKWVWKWQAASTRFAEYWLGHIRIFNFFSGWRAIGHFYGG